MTELAFTKQFLGALNSRPIKLNADHAEDPKSYPRPPYSFPKIALVPAAKKPRLEPPPSISIQFKTLRPPHISYSTPPLNVAKTTILTCKFLLSQNTTIPIDKLKLLYKGKVLGDVTFLREVFGDQGVEGGAGVLNVMLMGGAVPKAGSGAGAGVAQLVETGQGEMDVDKEGTPVVQAENKEADPGMEMDVDRKVGVLGTEEFWEELKAWLGSKLEGGEAAPEEVVHVFREAWKGVKGGQ